MRARIAVATATVAVVAVFTNLVGAVCGCNTPTFPSGGGGGESAANIWMDGSSGSCSRSSTPAAYDAGTACGTLNAAVQLAQPGDTIVVQPGVYPFDTLDYDATLDNLGTPCDPYGDWGTASTENCVHVVPNGDVTFRGMSIGASDLWLEGDMTGDVGVKSVAAFDNRNFDFHITNTDLIGNPPPLANQDTDCNCKSATFQIRPTDTSDTSERPDHVILDKLDTDTMSTFSADNVLWKDLDIGPLWIDTSTRGVAGGSGPLIPTFRDTGSAGVVANAVIKDSFIHEVNRTWWCDLGNVCHPDGLYIIGGGPYTISGLGMSRVSAEGMFFENPGNSTPNVHDVLVENSWAGCLVGSYPDGDAGSCGSASTPVDIKNCGDTTGCSNMLFRFNSFYGVKGAETQYSNVRWIGNATKQNLDAACSSSGVTWDYNAFYLRGGSGDCGTNAVNTGSSAATSLFLNTTPGSEDFHLPVGATVADNHVAGTSSDFLLLQDADGNTRPAGTNRDAGIDER